MAQAKTLTAAELRRATDYIATRPHAARNRAMLLTTHLAGLRVGEVALLSWSDAVDTNGQVREEIRLNADQTKGRHPRTVYVSPKLRKELQAYVNSIPARAPEAGRDAHAVIAPSFKVSNVFVFQCLQVPLPKVRNEITLNN